VARMPPSELHTITITARGAERLERGHPWVFRTDVRSTSAPAPGLARIIGPRGKPYGVGLVSLESEITLRQLDRDAEAVINAHWWCRAIERAIARRNDLPTHTTAWRVLHGEGDGTPSLVVDKYGDYLVVQLLSAGLETQRASIVAALIDVLHPHGILSRNDPAVRTREGLPRETVVLHGEVPDTIEIIEHGIRYLAAPYTGQKTGAFLDQRDNRRRIGALARGRALDCFSYHGSFALHLARTAAHVTAVDVSAPALERALENAARNTFTNITPVVADAFEFLREAKRRGEQYDTIVVDPPAFAKSRQSVPQAMRGYADINRLAMQLLAPGGVMLSASCSHHVHVSDFLEVIQVAASDSGRTIGILDITLQPVDHPVLAAVPETGYLKGVLLQAHD
jgi:23S rRNA (cytosine1962-C5)-methyltransferase